MSRHEASLQERLRQAGIALAGDVDENPVEMPWFVRALLAVSGWLAALCILGFIGLAMAPVIDSVAASALLGLVLMGMAYGLLRAFGSDFVEHLALASSLAGQLLVAWALVMVLDDAGAGLWWSLALLQGCLAGAMPNAVHRTFSTFAACLASFFAMAEIGMSHLVNGLVLLVLVWVWTNEFRWPGRLRLMQSLGHGLVLGLLAMQFLGRFGHRLTGWSGGPPGWEWAGAWLGEPLSTLALLWLIRTLLRRDEGRVSRGTRLAAYGGALVLLPVSWFAYGVTQGAVVLALGFAIGNRTLMGLGVVSLLFCVSTYYYLLDITLLAKSLTLLLLGSLLLAIRWWLRKRTSDGEVPGDA